MRRILCFLALILPLAGCQLSPPGRDAASAASPSAAGAITTTALDAAPLPPPPPGAATASAAPAQSPPAATKPPPARPAAAPAATAPGDAPAPLATPVATPIPKSDAQIACEKRGGNWARTSEDAITHACVTPTRDGGKRCDSKSDCDGECLARSRSCAPAKPLFGCNAVLTDGGAEVTLCLN